MFFHVLIICTVTGELYLYGRLWRIWKFTRYIRNIFRQMNYINKSSWNKKPSQFNSCLCAHVLMECGTMQSFKRYNSKMSLKTPLGINSWAAGGWSWHRKLKYGPDVFVMSARKNKEGCVSACLSALRLGNRLWFHFPLMGRFIHSVMIEWLSVLCPNTTSGRLFKSVRVDLKDGSKAGLNQ